MERIQINDKLPSNLFVSLGNIFCYGDKNAVSLYKTTFLIGVPILFRFTEKESYFFTLFCLLKDKTMGTLRYQYITYPL